MIVGHFALSALTSSSSSSSSSSSPPFNSQSRSSGGGTHGYNKQMNNKAEEYEDTPYESHLFLETTKNNVIMCDQRETVEGMGEIIKEEDDYNLHVLSNLHELKHYQLCLGMHDHRHTLDITILDGTCDLYFATTHLATPTSWDWKLNHKLTKKISIHTYASEFLTLNDGTFFVTVVNQQDDHQSKHDCHVNIKISPYSNERLLRQLPALRGGQVLLKRDLDNLKHNQKSK